MAGPQVSILMASYNMAEFLPAAIESVLAQEFKDFEILIGDNMSTDGTAEIARSYANHDARIKYHRNDTHLTAAQNFNQCLERSDARSRYWIMLASDDWWKPNLLRTLVDILDDDPALTFVHCDAMLTDASGLPTGTKYSELWRHMRIPAHGPHQAAADLFHGCYVMALATLVNRAQKDRIYPTRPLMDPSLVLAPDHNLWLQLMVRGAKAFFVDEPLAYYRKHSGAMTMPWSDIPRLHEEVAIFGNKLANACPSALEPVRLEAWRNRLAQLGFNYLALSRPVEAQKYLEKANEIQGRPRRDILCARVVAALPLPAWMRRSLWRQILAAARLAGRTA